MIHGWDGYPENNWFPWLKKELEARGFVVTAPAMPEPAAPHIDKWIPAIAVAVGVADKDTYFVGHSMGCQAIAQYLQTLPLSEMVGGAVFVAGFFRRLTNLENNPEVRRIADEWLGALIDFSKIKSHILGSVAIFSDDDRYVPLENQDDFRDRFDSEIVIENNKGHFDDSRGIKTLPVALEAVIKLSNK